MSLLDEAMEEFVVLNKSVVSDGYGGTVTEWSDGTTLVGAIVFNGSTQMQIAQAMGVTASYTLTVRKGVVLDYHDVLRRVSDGKIFRLTSDSDDMKTPQSAGLDMRQYTAEEWELPA